MFNFIRRYQLSNLKIKLLLLYLLNISDISLTIILVNTGLIIEANPLMANIITNSIATFFIKVLLPAVLFIYLYIRLKTATVKMIKLTNYCLIGLLGFYLIINVLHLVWFLMLPFFVSLYKKQSYLIRDSSSVSSISQFQVLYIQLHQWLV